MPPSQQFLRREPLKCLILSPLLQTSDLRAHHPFLCFSPTLASPASKASLPLPRGAQRHPHRFAPAPVRAHALERCSRTTSPFDGRPRTPRDISAPGPFPGTPLETHTTSSPTWPPPHLRYHPFLTPDSKTRDLLRPKSRWLARPVLRKGSDRERTVGRVPERLRALS